MLEYLVFGEADRLFFFFFFYVSNFFPWCLLRQLLLLLRTTYATPWHCQQVLHHLLFSSENVKKMLPLFLGL